MSTIKPIELYRANSTAELASSVELPQIIPTLPIRMYYRTAKNLMQQIRIYQAEGDQEASYMMMMKYMMLIVEKLKQHKEWSISSPEKTEAINGVKLIMDETERLKTTLTERYKAREEQLAVMKFQQELEREREEQKRIQRAKEESERQQQELMQQAEQSRHRLSSLQNQMAQDQLTRLQTIGGKGKVWTDEVTPATTASSYPQVSISSDDHLTVTLPPRPKIEPPQEPSFPTPPLDEAPSYAMPSHPPPHAIAPVIDQMDIPSPPSSIPTIDFPEMSAFSSTSTTSVATPGPSIPVPMVNGTKLIDVEEIPTPPPSVPPSAISFTPAVSFAPSSTPATSSMPSVPTSMATIPTSSMATIPTFQSFSSASSAGSTPAVPAVPPIQAMGTNSPAPQIPTFPSQASSNPMPPQTPPPSSVTSQMQIPQFVPAASKTTAGSSIPQHRPAPIPSASPAPPSTPPPSSTSTSAPSPSSSMAMRDTMVNGLRKVFINLQMMQEFMDVARKNTVRDIETCGILAGSLRQNVFTVTHLIIPKQTGSSDSCAMTNEDEVFLYQDKYDLLTLGWIHTHPSHDCFLSSVDMHTQFSYQLLLKEAVAIVMAPKVSPGYGLFGLTDPYGIQSIQNCEKRGFHPHEKGLYKPTAHVQLMQGGPPYRIVDLRTMTVK
eukprot:TRINITY_DN9168_c0_g1_i1.p1 TRINITY_DN9168_c0_g1~~TRINITY_DN9168_c0_g1_i1.p1  ORF type:complete len:662 (-),score=206.85 TRINITY_DN9168_c0_g1_i1:36-2021(-)